ncbi:energy transducer TonB [Paucibacter sp. TC2R-5]|uniref:energy transducer TonB n=1 Tax=Paucibacter sp. TC2R-5 TaxID=2893555 RepID=UPI0021E36B24|nr:energy transducer TonB [Paucibacter sp. TC2R-5]MCV2361381.1 energy transducer TonB [Paucibacter sp. TC2R-5]
MSLITSFLPKISRSGLGLIGAVLIAASAIAAPPPKVLKKVPPEFPAAAVKKGVTSGTVKAQLAIAADGKVTEVTILETSSPKLFDRAVIEALMEWRFEGSGEKRTHEMTLVFNE